MNGDELAMPVWLMVAVAVLVGTEVVVRLISRRSARFRASRFRRIPLAAAAALTWTLIGPGPTALRALAAASGLALAVVCEWLSVSAGGAVAAYRRALRRNAQALPATEHPPAVVAWLVLALIIATVGLMAANATQCSLFHRH